MDSPESCPSSKNQRDSGNETSPFAGGDTICTEVIAEKDADCPRRAVILRWNSPRKPPDGYNAQILEIGQGETDVESVMLKATKTSHKFEELKTDTKYICRVFPIYAAEPGNGTSSNQIQTSRRIFAGIEKMHNFGKTKNIIHKIVKKERGVFYVEISWDPVEVGENFRVEKYHIDAYEPGRIYHTYHLQRDYGPETTTSEAIALKAGKTIQGDIVTINRDLDTMERIAKKSQYSFTTQPCTPRIKGCECKGGEITFSWEAVDGAQKYTVVIEDLKSNMVETQTVTDPSCEAKFEISEKLCIGKTYKFILSADLKKVKSKLASRTYVIGGNYAVTNVVLNKDKAVPRRAVVVKWDPPKNAPDGYQIEIFQGEGNKRTLIKKENTEARVQTHRLTELKTDTTFTYKVSPVYGEVVKDGSYSNEIKTDTRITPEIETIDDYGEPEMLSDNAGSSNHDGSTVELSWSTIKVCENHKIITYHITVSDPGAQPEIIFNGDVMPNKRKLDVEKVKKGHTYVVSFTTVLMDLDSNELLEKRKIHTFSLRTSATNVEKCKILENGLIIFSWNTVEGAELYHLMVKDEFLKENLLEIKIGGTELSKKATQDVRVEKSEELRIGRTCMTKVIVYGNGLESASDWKPYLIGGELVPRNVKAKECARNPKRCIQVTFDAAKIGEADEYMVSPIPGSKIHKKGQLSKSSPVVVKYLRRGISYRFSVSARHGEKWSKSSLSNSLETQGSIWRKDAPIMKAHHVPAHFDNLYFDNLFTPIKGRTIEFGQVRNLTPLLHAPDGNIDLWEFKWKVPNFGNNASDYKVEKYNVRIGIESTTPIITSCLKFIEDEQKYRYGRIPLELGKTYEISVSTQYVDIDEDEEYISHSAKSTFLTRPCKPIVTTNKVEREALKLGWNHSNGADHYVVNLFVNDVNKYQINTGKETAYERSFDEDFGFGKTYQVVIDAVGPEGGKSSAATEKKMIVEDHVPKRVNANITDKKVTDPSTQVYLEWDPPEKTPISYEVTFKKGSMCNVSFHGETACVVFGLNVGTDYTFKVIAIHHDMDGKQKRSGGCFSSKIQTSPKPNQVQYVRIEPGLNPCTSVVVKWDKVNVARNDEAIKYRVIVTTLDGKINEETKVATNCKEVHGLQPNTLYFIKVAGGNKEGFGKNSEKLSFKTAEGKPKSVQLMNSVKAPSTELILQYTEMEGRRQTYFGILYEGQTLVSGPCEVKTGHKYKKLRANTNYKVEVYVEFQNREKGAPVQSNEVKTAPGKPEITEYGCCSVSGELSSSDLFLKWKTVDDVSCCQIRIIFERNGETEKEIMVMNENEMTYSCKNEACRYGVQVRAKTKEFGDWSDTVLIDLEPPILQNITAELDKDEKSILIQCKKIPGAVKYCMQALCNGVNEGPIDKKNQELFDGYIVKFRYLPEKSAEIYSFDLWAETNDDLKGKSARSNTVISKPEKVRNVVAKPAENNPSVEMAISWDAINQCSGYEMMIQCADSPTRESLTTVIKTSCVYTCHRPESDYVVRVRGLRQSIFGEWSDEAKVCLEPLPVENIEAALDEQGNIIIQCKKKQPRGPLQYCMRALCNDADEGIVEKKSHETVDDDFVKFIYMPKKTAEKYSFQLWGEKSDGLIGKKAFSNTVISRPEKVKTVLLELDNDNPSFKIKIGWNDVKRCDLYEVWVQCSDSERPECMMRVANTNCRYMCNNPGEVYNVRIRGLRQHCAAEWSENISTCLAPPIVESVEVSIRANPNIVNVTWKPLDKIPTKYIVALYQDNEKILEEETIATQHAFKDKIRPGCLCYCTVAAENDGGRGKIQSSISHRSVPAKIENLRCVRENENIIFEWDASEPAPDKYLLKWRLNNDSVTEESTEATKIKKRLAKGVQSYELEVTALNSTGRGKMAKKETIVPVPGLIKDVKSSFENGNVVYEWDPLEPSPDKYLIKWRVDNEPFIKESTEETKIEKRLIKGAKSYELRVAGSNIAGKGKTIKLKTSVPVCATVENLRSRVEDGNIIYEWDSLEPAPDEYVLKWRVNNEFLTKELTHKTTFKRHLVKKAHSYELSVAGSNSAGEGKLISRETLVPVPGVIKNLKSRLEEGNIIYDWDPPVPPADEYLIEWRVDNGALSEDTTEETTLVKRMVKKSQFCELRVAGSNSAGRGKFASLYTSSTENQVNRDWGCLEPEPGQVDLKLSANDESTSEESIKETTFQRHLITGARSDELNVAAENCAGIRKTNRLEISVPAPDDVKNVRSKRVNDAIIYEWDSQKIKPEKYIVQWKVNNGDIVEKSTKDAKFEIRDLKPVHSYKLRVMASNGGLNSDVSAWHTFVTGQADKSENTKPDDDSIATKNILLLRKILANGSEEITQWMRNREEKLILQGECERREANFRYISVSDVSVLENSSKLRNKLLSSSSVQKFGVKFFDCHADHLKALQELVLLKGVKEKITELSICYTDSVKDSLEIICAILEKCDVTALSLEYDNLDDEDVEFIWKYFEHKKVERLEKIDFSYNKNITFNGFACIGSIVREHFIGSIRVTACNITDTKLKSLLVGLKNYKLEELDISCNTKLSEDVFKILAEFVTKKGVKSLKLGGCNLTNEDIELFSALLICETDQLLEELDLSYNPMITPDACLGALVAKCRVDKLNMAGCKLSGHHLMNMRRKANDYKLDEFNMRDNFTIGRDITEVAEFAKDWQLQELNISECKLSDVELRSFREALGGVEFGCLHLGDLKRDPDRLYMQAICELLPNVKGVLHLYFSRLSEASRLLLQDHCKRSSIKIKFADGSAEEWSKVSEE